MELAIELLEKHLIDEFDLLKFMFRNRDKINLVRIQSTIIKCKDYRTALNVLCN